MGWRDGGREGGREGVGVSGSGDFTIATIVSDTEEMGDVSDIDNEYN